MQAKIIGLGRLSWHFKVVAWETDNVNNEWMLHLTSRTLNDHSRHFLSTNGLPTFIETIRRLLIIT